MLHDPFNRSALPADFDRQARVELLGQAAHDLMNGRLPDAPARLFLGGALSGWLAQGGRVGELERKYLQTAGCERSRLTAPELWRRTCASTATEAGPAATMTPDSTSPDKEPSQ